MSEKILSNIFLLFFFSFSVSFSQVNINGFYRFNNYKTFPNYSAFYQIDFNNDSSPDIIFFNGKNNNVVTLASAKDGSFSEPRNKFFFFPITAMAPFGNNNRKETLNIFVSRKERLAGLVSFTKSGTLKLLNILRFSTYPTNVISADLNADGRTEAVVFGKTFAGFALIKTDKFNLKDTTIFTNESFSDAAFINLDYDNFTDIAAINVLNNSIDFFYNDGNNNFAEERQIKFDTPISNLQTTDFNNDLFTDLIYLENNSIQILLGDSVSSFNRKIHINSDDEISDYLIGDFNSDKLNDIAYLDKKRNNIKILFGINDSSFTKPILLYKGKNFLSLQKYVNNNENGLLAFSIDGILSKFTNSTALPDSFRLAFAGNPTTLNSRNGSTDNNYQLSFIDQSELAFKYFSGKNYSLNKLFITHISNNFSKIKFVKNAGKNNSVILFNPYGQLIEILQSNKMDFPKEQIYTNNPILDALSYYNNSEHYPIVVALTAKNDSAYISFFKEFDSKFVKIKTDSLDTNIVTAKLFKGKNIEVFYWKTISDSLFYFRKDLQSHKIITMYKTAVKKDSLGNNLTNVKLFENDWRSASKPISIIREINSFKILTMLKNKIKMVSLAKKSLGNRIKSIENIKYMFDSKSRQKSFFVLANDSTAIFKLDFDKNFNLQSLSNYIESEKVYDYFVTKLFDKFNYIVYSSRFDNAIKFLRIK